MKKIVLLLIIAVFTSTATLPIHSNPVLKNVYICYSKGGTKYHYKKNCRGLSACKAPIKELSLADAEKIGKTLCGWE